eukprot:TRINITY_DN14327_c0_g1_i1.p1 TRINITY_DN14327_c0_g1~~TRINITY_DN14327_c0_g1_i1.p1  ORF type:complete len:349 (+),score=38.53 TRINITY_DN14327_c0_g1_i1:30-1049(+)
MEVEPHLLRKVEAILAVNNEIIQRLKSGPTSVSSFSYKISQTSVKPGAFARYIVQEETATTACQDIISVWKCHTSFEEIPALFSNTPSHIITNFTELLVLQKGLEDLLQLAASFLGEGVNALPALPLFKRNLESIQTCLGEIETSLQPGRSELDYYQEQVDQLNLILERLEQDPQVNRPPVGGMEWGKCGDGVRLEYPTKAVFGPNVNESVMGKHPLKHGDLFRVRIEFGEDPFTTIGVATADANVNTQTGTDMSLVYAYQVSHGAHRSPSPNRGFHLSPIKSGIRVFGVKVNLKSCWASLYVDDICIGKFTHLPPNVTLYPIVGNGPSRGTGTVEILM